MFFFPTCILVCLNFCIQFFRQSLVATAVIVIAGFVVLVWSLLLFCLFACLLIFLSVPCEEAERMCGRLCHFFFHYCFFCEILQLVLFFSWVYLQAHVRVNIVVHSVFRWWLLLLLFAWCAFYLFLFIFLWLCQYISSVHHRFIRSLARSYVCSLIWFDSSRLDMISMHGNFIKQFSITSCKAKSTLESQCIYLLCLRTCIVHMYPASTFHFFLFERKVHRGGVERGRAASWKCSKHFRFHRINSCLIVRVQIECWLPMKDCFTEFATVFGWCRWQLTTETCCIQRVSHSIGKCVCMSISVNVSVYICIYFSTLDMHFSVTNNFGSFNVIERARGKTKHIAEKVRSLACSHLLMIQCSTIFISLKNFGVTSELSNKSEIQLDHF